MKIFKFLDYFIQLLFIVLAILALFLQNSEKLIPFRFIIAFAIVQIIGIIIHLVMGAQSWKNKVLRKIHLIGTTLVLIAIGIAFILDSSKLSKYENNMAGPGILIYATIPAILLALLYTIISGMEWMKIKKGDS